MAFIDKYKALCTKNNEAPTTVALKLGISKGNVTAWEKNGYTPRKNVLEKIAQYFDVSLDYFSDNPRIKEGVIRIPVFGTIPAGIPMDTIEYIEDYEEAPTEWANGDWEYFALKIKGDSMSPEYRDGDVIIFRKQNYCNNGEDCAVMVNSHDATFKKVELLENGVILKPFNPAYKAQFFSTNEIDQLPVKIIGVFWELRRKRK